MQTLKSIFTSLHTSSSQKKSSHLLLPPPPGSTHPPAVAPSRRLRLLHPPAVAPTPISNRIDSSTAVESDAIHGGGVVSGGLAAEGLVFEEESASATAVKSDTLPTLLQPRVVVYHGVCHLCHRGVKFVIKADKDKGIKFGCLQSKTAEPYMWICGVDREDVLRRFQEVNLCLILFKLDQQ